MTAHRLVVLGTLAGNPYAGMAWMTMQIVVGLRRLGHDVHYLETTSDWPYDPDLGMKSCTSDHPSRYLARVADGFGVGDRWGYRRSYLDGAWLGPSGPRGAELLRTADAVLNIAGATSLAEDGLEAGRLVLLGTDPVLQEIRYVDGDPRVRALVDEHSDVLTYGGNLGTDRSPIPPLPRLRGHLRQPILLDRWAAGPPDRAAFTTVGNWRQAGLDLTFQGTTYRWSKHHEFERFLELPRRVSVPLELAMNLATRPVHDPAGNEAVPAFGAEVDDQARLVANGWQLVHAGDFTRDPWRYRAYVQASRAEFTVARDLNVRLRSGWFSERSACYLAAGRPVVTQDTGFGDVLPTGHGLFAFDSLVEAIEAIEAIEAAYEHHSRAARAIAEEHFRAETVLARMLEDLGL